MFFPIRKNLVIGLGLVNAINLSEFKAILAHEFGHFSQRSMKLGSYVYNVNHIIYNLLYDNEGYGRSLETWGSLSGIFALFATITVKIVQGIQWILQGVYTIINKQYMSLSREMEFHADTVAASVSGSESLITSLNRMELVDTAFNEVLQFYHYHGKEGIRPENLYPQHFENMMLLAKHSGTAIQEGLPAGEGNSLSALAKPRINFKDQWASHPSNEDRESNLRQLNIQAQRMPASAWAIFVKPERLQKEMTDKLYPAEPGKAVHAWDLATFLSRIESNREKFKIDDCYRGHFDDRDFTQINLEQVKAITVSEKLLTDILTDQVLALPHRFKSIATDLNTLHSMKTGELPASHFEFDGQKMHIADTFSLQQQLERELEEVKKEIEQSDERFIAFFLNAADRKGQKEQLLQQYYELLALISVSEEDHKRYVELMTEIMPIYQGGIEMDHTQNIMEKVRLLEVPIKERLQQFIQSSDKELLSAAERQRVAEYVEKDHPYFSNSIFLHNAFELLTDAMVSYSNLAAEKKTLAKKQLLESQLRYLE
ncbi:MAG: hypothetical protein DI538_17660 [Azospira oryzae]|nr:MAG: hypothetical protein DI538_17660 [Azospira oryzae]